jgi:hypothetical protein
MAHDVFISFAVEDEATADAVCAALEASRIRCWIAPRDVLPGVDCAQAIVEAISQSRVMVLVFSSRSNHSPHIRREVGRAVSREIEERHLVRRLEALGYTVSLQSAA